MYGEGLGVGLLISFLGRSPSAYIPLYYTHIHILSVVSIWRVKSQMSRDKPKVSWSGNTICPESHSVFYIKSLKQSWSSLTLLFLLKHIIMGFQGGGYNLLPSFILVTRCNQIFQNCQTLKKSHADLKNKCVEFFFVLLNLFIYFTYCPKFPLPPLLHFPPNSKYVSNRFKECENKMVFSLGM